MEAFSVLCKEGSQEHLRHVRQLLPDPADALEVYDRVQKVQNLFGSTLCADTLRLLISCSDHFWRVDDVGVIYAAPLGRTGAHVHITFWDKRLRGREQLCRELAARVVSACGYDTLWTAIPRASKAVLAFAKRIGFRVHSTDALREVLYAPAACFTMKQPGENNGR